MNIRLSLSLIGILALAAAGPAQAAFITITDEEQSVTSTVDFKSTRATGVGYTEKSSKEIIGDESTFDASTGYTAVAPPGYAPGNVQTLATGKWTQLFETSGYATGSGIVQITGETGCTTYCSSVSYAGVGSTGTISFELEEARAFRLETIFTHGAVLSGSPYLLDLVSELMGEGQHHITHYVDENGALPSGPSHQLITGTLPAGNYVWQFGAALVLRGEGESTLFGEGSYSTTLSLTTPVPLPAAAWLLLSGLGGVAAVARRRRSATTPASQSRLANG